jgi:hypothetical protein
MSHATGVGRWWVALKDHPGVGVLALGQTAHDALGHAAQRDPQHFAVANLNDVRPRLIDESTAEPRVPAESEADYLRRVYGPALRRIAEHSEARAREAERRFLEDTRRLADAIVNGTPYWGTVGKA